MVPGQNMSGIDFFFLVVPVTLVLFGWIGMVLWAGFHPKVRRRGPAAARNVLTQGGVTLRQGEATRGAVPRQPGVAEQDAAGRVPRQQAPTPRSPGPVPSRRPAGPGRRTLSALGR